MKQIILKKYHVTYFTIQAFEKAFKTSREHFGLKVATQLKILKGQ